MSVSAAIVRILANTGRGVEEIISVAEAMERGDQARAVFDLVAELQRLEASNEVIAIAVCGLAVSINDGNKKLAPNCRTPSPNPDARDSNRARRNMPNNVWRELRATVLAEDEFSCQYCGSRDNLTCDHVLPLARGGGNERSNLTTACRSCNSSKGDRTPNEWSPPIGGWN